MQNLTNYSASGLEGGNVDVAIAYDSSGQIHAIFDTAPASGETTPTNLYHWSIATGVRLITSAGWTNTCGGGTITNIAQNNGAGTNNLAIACRSNFPVCTESPTNSCTRCGRSTAPPTPTVPPWTIKGLRGVT
jgi:hypothetical protein